MRALLTACLLSLLLSACMTYAPRLQPGVSTANEVIAQLGAPALHWQDADGSRQLAYPRGPWGVHTFMVHLAADGRVVSVDNVLQMRYFARLVPAQSTQDDVLRLLGPPNPAWTTYYAARNELVWEWLFCDDWSRLARFDVLFDATTGVVRSSFQRPDLRGPDGVQPYCSK